MRHTDLHSASQRRLLTVAAIVAAVAVFAACQPRANGRVSLAAPAVQKLVAAWAHDDSVPDTANTLSHETLADDEPASTF